MADGWLVEKLGRGWPNPVTNRLAGGFVPVGTCLSDDTPHPHAGTGFAISHSVGFPVGVEGNLTA